MTSIHLDHLENSSDNNWAIKNYLFSFVFGEGGEKGKKLLEEEWKRDTASTFSSAFFILKLINLPASHWFNLQEKLLFQ